ncbi:permease [Terrihabitans soli]|uniref:Permease n=1 Tax=Terrihabitans soli TaxID=708113 RepID=A0A6S6QN79_9HYPH|nr:LPS export ABC transporter permease LptF [Terrihabitans soli]BCJ90856.1 permease [Terrihabitans soli]
MGALERYILRSAATAFVASLCAVTAVVWLSQTLRKFDIITSSGQSFWTFLMVTLLGVPSFALLVAPLALFGAVVFTLNRLNNDSELAAISAAGFNPWQLLRPFLLLTIVVSLVVGALSLSAIPETLRVARELLTKIRTDVVVNILREGEFTELDKDLTIHIRRRDQGAALTGILIDDSRNAAENLVYTAERGQILRNDGGTFLVLEKGALQRKRKRDTEASLIVFDRYAFDLSPLTERDITISYRPRELYLSELWNPKPADERARKRLRAELHERLVNPLYPLAFMCIAFAALGRPHTTRQSRFASIVLAIIAIFALQVAGLGMVNLMKNQDWAILPLYGLPVAVSFICLAYALGRPSFMIRNMPRRPRQA